MDFYGYPCIDLLWILDPGIVLHLDGLVGVKLMHLNALVVPTCSRRKPLS